MTLKLNLNELSFENVGAWPNPVKIVAAVLLSIAVMMVVYYLDTSSQIDTLNQYQQKEIELRQTFEKKYYQAASLKEYEKQLEEMRDSLATMLHQLPSREEVPGLLEEISKSGRTSGLEFKLFDPEDEVQHDFYAELPIEIIVKGDYHQFGDFVTRISALGRIVTLHDIDIKMENVKLNNTNSKTDNSMGKANGLQMVMLAKTYRYSEEKDQGKKDDAKNKKNVKQQKPA